MRAVLQRAEEGYVCIDNIKAACIEKGIVVLVGFNENDDETAFNYIIDKIINLRIFADENGKMNLSVKDINGGLLIIPNFTLYSDARKGRRPNFSLGASPKKAEKMFNEFIDMLKKNFENVQTGIFKADMKVCLINDGPVTILLDSDRNF